MKDIEKLTKKQLENQICESLNICDCQRHTDRVFKPIKILFEKLIKSNNDGTHLAASECTDEELLIIALLDRRVKYITHGINLEYPIAFTDDCQSILDGINKFYELIEQEKQR